MNRVIKKVLYYVQIQFASPISVTSGDGQMTDNDVLRDYEGIPFVAGTSLAGAFRDYLQILPRKDSMFGYADGGQGKISRIYISDLRFCGEVKIVSRDGVALSDKKSAITGAKYDMETIDSGASGYFILELVIREQDEEEDIRNQVHQILHGIESGDIRLGCKKTRGYGEMRLKSVGVKEFTAENMREYADAYICDLDKLPDEKEKYLKEEYLKEVVSRKQTVDIEVPLRIRGGISIRQYAVKKGEPDFVHITANEKPVIPGTSFAGALRSRVKEMLRLLKPEMDVQKVEEAVEGLFGYVHDEKAHRSNIIISESVIEHAHRLTTARTAVSRFENAVKKGSLYTERTYVDGTLTLRMKVLETTEKWMIGLLLLALEDLQHGYLPIGGETSIGRGIFEADGPIRIDGEPAEEDVYFVGDSVMQEG
ncbi:MAG: RAMP superfamily CRISPR-associated protein [bacterium]|nr:RAMP superfamily CRISPR-associated protein [bacterium]